MARPWHLLVAALSVICLGISMGATYATLRSNVEVEVVIVQGPEVWSIFNIPRSLLEDVPDVLAIKLRDTHRDVYARILSGPLSGGFRPISGFPTQDLTVGTRAQVQLERSGGRWGGLQFPRDFWPALTLAFLGLGFGAYALHYRRRCTHEGTSP